MSDGQQLNSLDRFRKQPGRLVLEEHGHCEIPAGCGGVVLRWRNPHAYRPVLLHLYTPVRAGCWVDGDEPRRGRIDLAPGRHLVAVALEKINPTDGLLMFAALHDTEQRQTPSPDDADEPPLQVLTADDGTWKFTLEPPPASWNTSVGFDDRAWSALTTRPTPEPDRKSFGAWQFRKCAELGAVCLGLPKPIPLTDSIWVRKVFNVHTAPPPA